MQAEADGRPHLASDGRVCVLEPRRRRVEGASAEADVKRRVTIVDVAREAGVSIGTVSRFLNKSPRISPEASERVDRAIRRIGFTPNAMAQGLRRERCNVIGCLINDISHPLNALMFAGAEQSLREAGFALIVVDCGYQPDAEPDLFRFFTERNVDGLLATVSIEDDPVLHEAMKAAGMPIVLWERLIQGCFDSALTDHHAGCHAAARYLLALGHRRVGLINASDHVWPGRERARALRQAFDEEGMPFNETWIRARSSAVQFGFSEALELLRGDLRPTALIAGVNEIVGVLRAARLLELAIPRDLSLIACGETHLSTLIEPALTVVRWDVEATGRIAAELLLERMENHDQPPRVVTVPSELIIRASCASASS